MYFVITINSNTVVHGLKKTIFFYNYYEKLMLNVFGKNSTVLWL